MPSTSNYLGLIIPTVGGDNNDWGGYLNTDLTKIDNIFDPDGNGTAVGINHTGRTVNVTADSFFFKDLSAPTKIAKFDSSQLSPGSTRTYIFPDASDTLVVSAYAQTLTNKTLTAPILNGSITGTPVFTTATSFTADISMNAATNPTFNYLNTESTKGYRFKAALTSGVGATDSGFLLEQYAGGTSWTEIFKVGPNNGGITIGSPVDGLKGAGTVNAEGLYVDGVSIPAVGIVTALVRFTIASGTITPVTSYNVATVTRPSGQSKGVFDVTFTTPLTGVNYVAIANGPAVSGSVATVSAQATDKLTITMAGGNLADPTAVNVVVFGS